MGFWQDWVTDDLPSNYIGPTTWLFLLSPRWSLVMLIGLTTVAFQVCILVAFVQGTDEQLFFPSCGKWDGSYDPVTLDPIAPELFCERDIADIWVVIAAGFIALAWTLPDIFQGFQFWISSCHFPHSWPQRIQLLIAGIFSMEIGGYRFFAANSWLYRDAPNNAQAILGVVGILYVMDVDEALFRVLGKVAPHWHTRMCQEVDDHFREGFKPGGTNRRKESNSSTEIKQSPNERDQGHTELFSPEHS